MTNKTTVFKRINIYLFSGLMILGVSQSASGSLINGGFETGDLTGWNVFDPDPASPLSVDVFPEISTVLCCEPSEGSYFAAFNRAGTDADGRISQDFATVSGVEYLLTFDFAKGGTSAGIAALNVNVSGIGNLLNTQGQVATTTGGAPGAYTSYSFNFVADSASTTLLFRDISTGEISSFDALLDNVSVSAVPLPASIWLFGTALIGLVGFNKRRKSA